MTFELIGKTGQNILMGGFLANSILSPDLGHVHNPSSPLHGHFEGQTAQLWLIEHPL